ncbi:MAG TPA: hypothetical protein VFG11_06360 [Acidobacteriota bacterium]|nr:hypothetical protein [Acidobacteriota bacterium]
MQVDTVLLWEWEFDDDFVRILDRKLASFGLSSYVVHPFNLRETEELICNHSLTALAYYDRASDTDPMFEPAVHTLKTLGAVPLNDPQRLETALDKAAMHQRLIDAGMRVPYTIILSPNRDWTKIKIGELMRLGEPFIIKPALGGGGVGVELNAKTLFDIEKARQTKAKEKFLLQEKVLPAQFGGRRAWFRVYYICGNIVSCWWDDHTHIYFRVTEEEERIYGLDRLKREALKLAKLSGLNFFSTEIAIVDRETLVVIDYINDQCDMRLKSRFPDGVPDDVVEQTALEIARHMHQTLAVGVPH